MMRRGRLAKSSTQVAAASSFLGVKFTKYFKKTAFEGTVVSYKRPFFLVKYCDGDTEEMTLKELGGACEQQKVAAAANPVAKKTKVVKKKRARATSMEFSSQILSLEYEQRKRYYNDLIVTMLDEERIPFTATSSIVLLDDEALRSSRRFSAWIRSSERALASRNGEPALSSSSKHATYQKQITVVNRRQDVAFLAESAGFTGFVGDLARYALPFQIAYCDFCSVFSTNRGLLERFLHLLDSRHAKCTFFASFSLRAVNRESCFREMRAVFTDPATVAGARRDSVACRSPRRCLPFGAWTTGDVDLHHHLLPSFVA